MKVVIGTRGSRLALTQTKWVIDELEKHYPELACEMKIIKTKGDLIQDKPLDKIGDKGIFTKEIEAELLKGNIDMAVHSMKDMPSELPLGLRFTRTLKREDARDVLILKEGYASIEDLPIGATIATGSKRRKYQLLAYRSDLNIVPIRGNVDTRLCKLEEEKLEGIVLAAAGLHRLGLADKITCYLPMEIMLPAPAQGALAIEIRQEDTKAYDLVKVLEDPVSSIQVEAERAFMDAINGGCHMPIGAYCEVIGTKLRMRGLLGDELGKKLVIKELCAPIGSEKQLGEELASVLRKEFEKNDW
ncbi:hydroxymethylbilane synthase [Cellulosilyticum lentocellum]|uniref:Porphobilinogen deaminase n=1 Tax=Cellulosilyticum lentocellum (strain ATCC 49066 / DSM 5427 / NCIMB 11756 / RHM5) TaxID=642492 RepID=F2JGZ9_CELLD|nr:hydroxymethylbilane synthase [Cellulosilyticum lentocellum]ADZ85339.1 porphobilinogen deaminase [Cellulosilyticum lentocellum DSM 5427]